MAGAGVLPTTVLLAETCTVGSCLHLADDGCAVREERLISDARAPSDGGRWLIGYLGRLWM